MARVVVVLDDLFVLPLTSGNVLVLARYQAKAGYPRSCGQTNYALLPTQYCKHIVRGRRLLVCRLLCTALTVQLYLFGHAKTQTAFHSLYVLEANSSDAITV